MNIYIRSQAYDLCKYLNDAQAAELQSFATIQEIPAGTIINQTGAEIDYLIIMISGELVFERDGRFYGKLCCGEILNEIHYFKSLPAIYQTRAVKASKFARLSFRDLDSFISRDFSHAARIHAALNDSLCLKIVRHTHLEN